MQGPQDAPPLPRVERANVLLPSWAGHEEESLSGGKMKSVQEYWVTTNISGYITIQSRSKKLAHAIKRAKGWTKRDRCKYRVWKVDLMEVVDRS